MPTEEIEMMSEDEMEVDGNEEVPENKRKVCLLNFNLYISCF